MSNSTISLENYLMSLDMEILINYIQGPTKFVFQRKAIFDTI